MPGRGSNQDNDIAMANNLFTLGWVCVALYARSAKSYRVLRSRRGSSPDMDLCREEESLVYKNKHVLAVMGRTLVSFGITFCDVIIWQSLSTRPRCHVSSASSDDGEVTITLGILSSPSAGWCASRNPPNTSDKLLSHLIKDKERPYTHGKKRTLYA